MQRRLLICLVLTAATLAVFLPVRSHDFLSYDDRGYVSENRQVRQGLSPGSLSWALGTFEKGNWHPITWWSHMIDYQLFGSEPAGHHLVNLVLHAANVLLLFVVLERMSGAIWQSAFVAALFALHPLHVESVAWIADRKDVLRALFWMLTLLFYARYVERPGRARYLAVLACFALGLTAKPMLVSLPFVMLLLDFWPLGRFSSAGRAPSRLLLEKLPLFVLAAASGVVTVLAQPGAGAVGSIESLPLSLRAGNALTAYAGYLGKTIWPAGLSVIYILRPTLTSAEVLRSGLILAAVSVGVALTVRRRPYLAVGWLWFLGTLVPVIGLVQVGRQAMADRYTYIPLIGVFIMVAWGLPALLDGWRHRRLALAVGAAIVLSALTIATRHQLGYWKNSVTLFGRAVELDADNDVAHRQLALVMMEQGRNEEALHHYSEALRVIPDHPSALTGKGILLAMQGRTVEAIALFARALEVDPGHAQAHYNLGNALAESGRSGEAIPHFGAALDLEPDRVEIRVNLAHALLEAGRLDEAMRHLGEALRLEPDSFEARYNLAIALAESGRLDEAIARFVELVARHDVPEAHHGLAIALLQQGRLDEAIDHFSIAVRKSPDVAEFRRSLDAARRLAASPGGELR